VGTGRPDEGEAPSSEELSERLEAFRARSLILTKLFRPYLVGLLSNQVLSSSGMPVGTGSGIIIRSDVAVFVLTAAHVWSDALDRADEIRIGHAVFERSAVSTIAFDEERDIATIALPPGNDGRTIGAIEYPYEDIGRAKRWTGTIVFGFPTEVAKVETRDDRPGLRLFPAILLPTPEEFDAVRRWFGSEPADWQKFDVGEPGGALVPAPDLGGMSGGPVFQDIDGKERLVGVHVGRSGGLGNRRFYFSALWDMLADGSLRAVSI